MEGTRAVARVEGPLAAFSRDIKLEHTLFALPFALIGALAAQRTGAGAITPSLLILILAAMVTARTAAMGFNRWHDAPLDAANPRTKDRAIPSGRLASGTALAITIAAAALFTAAAFAINRLAGLLSPLALVVILGYSTTKRWTAASHLVLGLSLAMAPAGGWIAVAGRFAPPLFLLAGAVLFWVAGFDILYAMMDMEFDRGTGLHSIPARLGERAGMTISRVFHLATIALLAGFGEFSALGWGWRGATMLAAACLVAEHILAHDRRKIPTAFFHVNAAIGGIMLAGMLI